jgi:hypothetical protein
MPAAWLMLQESLLLGSVLIGVLQEIADILHRAVFDELTPMA